MSQSNTPDWIKNLHRPPKDNKEYPPEVDAEILGGLQKLSFDELDELAGISGVRDITGELTPPEDWDRDQYIEILSDIGDMTDGQVNKIRAFLNIDPK